MIKEAKDVLEMVVKACIPQAYIARNKAEEGRAIMARQWPLVSLITNPGRFDDKESRWWRYEEAGVMKQRYVRGTRILPILLRCFAEGEEETDKIFSRIIPAIPRRWSYDNFLGYVVIGWEEHSDFVDSVNKLYASVAEIEFSVPVAMDENSVPVFDQAENTPEFAPAGKE